MSVLGANIANVHKQFDDNLKKRLDNQQSIKQRLNILSKKGGSNLTQRDLTDAVYEKINDIGKDKFIQSHSPDQMNYSNILTTVLVVINNKKLQFFQQNYITFLSEHNRNDFENWKKRQENILKSHYNNIDDPAEMMEKVAADLDKLVLEYEAKIDSPGVVPFSDTNLNIVDADKNMLFSIVCMKD